MPNLSNLDQNLEKKFNSGTDGLSSFYNFTDLESYAFCEISSSIMPAIVYFDWFLALVHNVNLAIS